MARTINRTPYTVSEPDISYKFFNHNNWKGVCDDKNFLGVDQESFADAKNIYIDSEGVLKTRPSIVEKSLSNLTNCSVYDAKTYENTLVLKVYNNMDKKWYYKFYVDNIYITQGETTEKSKILLFDNKLIIFNTKDSHINLYTCYDLIEKTFSTDASSLIYVPIIAEYSSEQNVKTISESKNILTNSYKERYIYTDAGMPTQALGKQISYELSFYDSSKTVVIPSYDTKYDKYLYSGINVNLPISFSYSDYGYADKWEWSISKAPMTYSNGLWIMYYSTYHIQTGANDASYSEVTAIGYSFDGKTYKYAPNFPNGLSCVYSSPELSRDGSTVYVILSSNVYLSKTVYLYKWMPKGENPDKWTLCGTINRDDMYTNGGIGIDAHSDVRCVVSFNSTGLLNGAYYYNGSSLEFIGLTTGSQSDDYIKYVNGIRCFISNNCIYFVSYAKMDQSGTSYGSAKIRIDTYFINNKTFSTTKYLGTLATDSNGRVLQSVNATIPSISILNGNSEVFNFPYISVMLNEPTVFSVSISVSNNTVTTNDGAQNVSAQFYGDAPTILQYCDNVIYAYKGQYLDAYQKTFSKSSPKFLSSTDGVSVEQNVIGLPAKSEQYAGGYVTNTFTNYVISQKITNDKIVFYYYYNGTEVNEVLPDFISTLNQNVIAIGNRTYIDANRESDDLSKKLLYFPEALLKRYDYDVNALHPISTSQMGVFFDDSVWIIQRSENKLTDTIYPDYLYTKSQVRVGLTKDSDVVTSYDGTKVIFATQRGLVAMSYQDFIASTDQSLTYLSDNILVPFVNYCKDSAVKMFLFRYWLIIYKQNASTAYVIDLRNGSWWPMEYKQGFIAVCVNNGEPLIVSNNSLFAFDTNDESCKDWDKTLIEWKLSSQKLHFDAPNYYKHLYSLTINAVNDSQKPIAYLLGTTNYRNIANVNSDEVMNYQVDVIRSYVKRMNYSKVNEFQYELRNSKSTPSRLSISNITLKYTITSLVR